MQDKVLKCRDCEKEFTFTVSEQEFYKEKGFENDPTRCEECRRIKKQQRKAEGFGRQDGFKNGGGGFKKRY